MRLALATCLVVGLGLGTNLVDAWALPVTDLDGISLGTPLPGYGITNTFRDVDTNDPRGTVQGAVWQTSDGFFNYVLDIAPNYAGVEGVEVVGQIMGLTKWGYSFTDVQAAFGSTEPGSVFEIFQYPTTLTVEWDATNYLEEHPLQTWTGPAGPNGTPEITHIHFFLQSTLGPDGSGVYSLIDGGVASAISNAPVPGRVPEPGTLILLGSGLVGTMGMLRSRKRSQGSHECPK